MSENTTKREIEGLESILSAIRKMVRRETRSRLDIPSDADEPATDTSEESHPQKAAPPAERKVLLLKPHMRVKSGPKSPDVLPESEKIPYAAPVPASESFAIANPVVDEEMLREIVREVVQEQLRGEIGRDIIRAMKVDLIRSLEKF